jgi:hypothetical protein|tara:strand:+ start:1572 stop:2639 length:1068 start_codon:yes stop_codon:yes gene_type:complete
MAYTTIDDPAVYFTTVLWTGNATGRNITTGMDAAMVWYKGKSYVSNHSIVDAVRGTTKVLIPNNTDEEATDSGSITAFNSDNFTIGTAGGINADTKTYVGWCWKAGTTSGITTTGADITPSAYSFNHTSRISIAAYTGNGSSGAKIAHGLGAIPEVMIIKPRDRAGQAWLVYHHKNTSSPETDYLALDTDDATADAAFPWNDAVPTSVYLETQTNNGTNASGNTFVLYTFRGVQGYSKFGSYIGNGNVDGAFVYTGFKPAFLLLKSTTGGGDGWYMVDNKNNPFNEVDSNFFANSGNAISKAGSAAGDKKLDFLSNGFKIRTTNSECNSSGVNYIYLAFAEEPFVNSNGVPCTAR